MARIALDIDSTLHHYWGLLEDLARERFGIEIPYVEQRGWGIDELERDQLVALIAETHSDENIAAAEPYPGAAEVVRAWHAAGHWIHVTSHRREQCGPATERWLRDHRIPFDDLHCSFDKISRCVELGIDVLVDDSPVNIERAREHGILAATITHPWNSHLGEGEGVVSARDWPGLGRLLTPRLDVAD